MEPRRFILTAIDPEYGNPSFETLFVVERPEDLRTLLDISSEQDPGLEMTYRLDQQEVAAIARHFGIELPSVEQGMLFGYEDWQNDWWIEDLRRRNRAFGTMLVWMAVDEQACPASNSLPIVPCLARMAT
jgi:hypothetical protein